MIEYFITNPKDEALFIYSKEKRFAFLNISKNAITSLKALVLQERGLTGLDHCTIHRMIGHYPNLYNIEPYNIKRIELECNTTFIKFAVIRDPISRLISVYKLFWIGNFSHPYFQLIKDLYKIDSFDKFIDFVKNVELQKPILELDEHIRKLAYWLQNIQYLDYIVPILYLNNFVNNILGINTFEVLNNSNHTLILTDTLKLTIADIYKDDYNIISKIPNKLLYKPLIL